MQITDKKVIIMLASYNGELYIREQLDSIINNDYKNINLIISDDGSTDNTWQILEEYAKKYSFIILIKNESENHGALWNFANLIKYVKKNNIIADYYMFSDQDDVWKTNKISISVEKIAHYDRSKAVLLYTSQQYVDEVLNPINVYLKGKGTFDINIIHQNITYGCTYIFNFQLLKHLEYNISDEFINYDHYTAIQAFLYGKVYYLPDKTILYRQHANNVSGVIKKSIKSRLSIRKKYESNIKLYKFLIDYVFRNGNSLSKSNFGLIEKLYIVHNNSFKLFFYSLRYGIKKDTLIGTLQFYFALLFC